MSMLTRGRRPVTEPDVPGVDDALAVLTRSFESRTVRVNLLPPEISEARRLRTVQLGLAGTALVVTGAVGGLWWHAHGEVVSARSDRDLAQEAHDNLQGQVTRLQPVNAVFQQVDSANLMYSQARAGAVDWPKLLDSLSRRLPPTTWLTSLGLGQAGASSSGPTAATTTSQYGTVTFSGSAEHMEDGAAVIDALNQTPGLEGVVLSGLDGSSGSVSWSATAGLTAAALLSTTPAAGQ